jgi:DNA modification methylase
MNNDFSNRLIQGDNLETLKSIADNSVDLIYLDPPFFSNREYETFWGDENERRSFDDRWEGGIQHYIGWLKKRVAEMHRILKSTGSIFLHCDWHANAYIRVEILDKLFGKNHFINEFIWYYYNKLPDTRKKIVSRASDTIYWYSKGNDYSFNVLSEKREQAVKQLKRKKVDGKAVNARDEQGNVMYQIREERVIDNVWRISMLQPADKKERIGYPTQKPEALLERIIALASNEGDIVLDPFVGGGTTVAVADRMNRRWIGIDISVSAISVTDLRLQKQRGMFSKPYVIENRIWDYDELNNMNPFEFEQLVVKAFGGVPNEKQRHDFGLDGRMPDGIPLQVKQQNNVVRGEIDKFVSAIQRFDEALFEKNITEKRVAGHFIAFSFSKGSIEEVARLRNSKGLIIDLVKVKDILPYGIKPKVKLTAEEIEKFTFDLEASAESETPIDYYAWDFSHNEAADFQADILVDKQGKQTKKFDEGEHQVAVKATDKQGLRGVDKVKIKVGQA